MKVPFKFGDLLVYLFILFLIAGSFAGLYQMGRGIEKNQVTVEVDGEVWAPMICLKTAGKKLSVLIPGMVITIYWF